MDQAEWRRRVLGYKPVKMGKDKPCQKHQSADGDIRGSRNSGHLEDDDDRSDRSTS